MSEQELRTAIERASVMVDDLCAGSEVWRMRIPAQPDRDPDLVISAGLEAGEKALKLLATERERADRAEQALQAAQAEAAALRKALAFVQADIQGRHMTTAEQVCAAALSGDAGAAFLAEREAMRALIAAYRAYDDHVAINRDECRFCGVGYERACAVASALEVELEARLTEYDALSAPAAEECCRTPMPGDCAGECKR